MKALTLPCPLLDPFLGEPERISLDRYKDIILRDLEELFNTRLSSPLGSAGEDELRGETDFHGENQFRYGLADLSGGTESELSKSARNIRRCLELYEPRLNVIQVEAVPPESAGDECLTIFIEAGLAGFKPEPSALFEVPIRYV